MNNSVCNFLRNENKSSQIISADSEPHSLPFRFSVWSKRQKKLQKYKPVDYPFLHLHVFFSCLFLLHVHLISVSAHDLWFFFFLHVFNICVRFLYLHLIIGFSSIFWFCICLLHLNVFSDFRFFVSFLMFPVFAHDFFLFVLCFQIVRVF